MADSLTFFELQKIEALRQALGDKLLAETPIFNDDLSLHRWLVGWDYKFDEIIPRFTNASKTLECLSLKDLIIEDIDELNLYLNAVTDASKYYSSSVLGFDDDGNVIFVNNMGLLDCKNLNKSTPNSDLYINCITEAALTYQLIKCQEQKLGKKCGVRGIIDLDGFGLDHFNNFASKVTRNLIKQLLSMFVDTSLQMFIINAHPMATAAFKLITPSLPKQTRDKLIMLGSDYQTTLLNELGAHNVYEKWGGTKKPEKGHLETGLLRVGGEVPESRIHATNLKIAEFKKVDGFKFNIPARQSKEIDIDVMEGKELHWIFTASSEIDFEIIAKNGKQVWPKFRLTTSFVPELGSVLCRKGKSYKARFDNSFSRFFSKDIEFKYVLKDGQ